MRSRRLGSFVAVLVAVLVLGGPPSVAQQPIRIGVSVSLTGKAYSVQGGYGREGYLLCQKHLNAQGGVLGRPIQFVIYDDASDEKTAAQRYEKLIAEDKVDAVLGPRLRHHGSRGRCQREEAITIQWQDGKQVVVWPDELMGGKLRFPAPRWSAR